MMTDRRNVLWVTLESTMVFYLVSTGIVKFVGEEGSNKMNQTEGQQKEYSFYCTWERLRLS